MPYPISVKTNDYRKNPKRSDIYTPVGVAQFLYDILSPIMRRAWNVPVVFDPAVGSGRLTDPWYDNGCCIHGCDMIDAGARCHSFDECRFEEFNPNFDPDIVLCNSPFNGAEGRHLYPEVFLRRIFDLFGPKVPTVLICPMGMRLNQKKSSGRWKWLRDCGAKITSIVSLPTNAFPGVDFHVEILIFNVPGLQSHYFLPEEALC